MYTVDVYWLNNADIIFPLLAGIFVLLIFKALIRLIP